MNAVFITICGLLILLGIEIRHKAMNEGIGELRDKVNRLSIEILKLTEDAKAKKIMYR